MDQYFYVVQPYGKTNIIAVFEILETAKYVLTEEQAKLGFYTRWSERNGVVFASHYDGTVVYIISAYPRNCIMTPEMLESLKERSE